VAPPILAALPPELKYESWMTSISANFVF
jgi:hypothetical protein